MNQKTKKLFDLQTNILLNHILTNLMAFFLNPKITELHLYDTIIPIRSITRTDLRKAGKTIPNTFRYELWIKLTDNKLLFLLRTTEYSEIEIYNLHFTIFPPTVSTLKNIATILVENYHPMPTKIDKEFSKLAKNYSDYLEYYDVKRQWNNGYVKKRKSLKTTAHMGATERDILYKEFFNDLTHLSFEYRVFSKMIIDAYRTKQETIYINKDKTYELIVYFAKPNKISLKINCLFENYHSHEIIDFGKFNRNNKFFKKNVTLYNAILSCVALTLNA